MIVRKIIISLLLIFFVTCRSQTPQKLTFESLKVNLVDFLLKKNELSNDRAEKLKRGEFTFNLRGVNNNLRSGLLKNGMYAFSTSGSHSKGYFVLVENSNYLILDISTRQELETAVKNTLDFCERNKYCVDLTNDYISRLIGVFYRINKNTLAGKDINCERGIREIKDLP